MYKNIKDFPELQNVIKYYIENVNCDFTNSFECYISDNINEDYKVFEPEKIILQQFDGLVMTPNDLIKQIIMIKNECNLSVWFHELTHAYDIFKFKEHFSINTNEALLVHPFHNTLRIWSEFHAYLLGKIYTSLYKAYITNDQTNPYDILNDSVNKTLCHAIYQWNNNSNKTYNDIMRLYASVTFCRLYSKSQKQYTLQDFIKVQQIPEAYLSLFDVLYNSRNFDSFLNNKDDLYRLFCKVPLTF